jgi:hypothetical protein
MARLLKRIHPNGLDVLVGKLTPAQEADFYRRTGAPIVGYARGSRPNLGRSNAEPSQQPLPAERQDKDH